jgi:hypothetical protein
MDQSVMTFAGTAARGSAITTPVEGMVTYLNDIDALSVYNGTQFVTNRPIMTFGGTAARGSAISSPVEGMTTYLEDLDRYESYSGSAWEQVVTPGAWVAYTPATTGLTLGNGTISAFYSRIGRTVIARIRFTLGSTSAMGSFPNFSLPFTANSFYSTQTPITGLSFFYDNSADAQFFGRARFPSNVTIDPIIDTVSGTRITINFVTATAPMTWAVSDRMELQFIYEAAA